eukprot:UN20065
MIGEDFILTLIARHGVVVYINDNNSEKIFTVVLSFWLFTKPFTMMYLVGGGFHRDRNYVITVQKKPSSFSLKCYNSYQTTKKHWNKRLVRWQRR